MKAAGPGVRPIGSSLVEELVAQARKSARGRINYNFHSSPDEPVHRFLNVLTRDTYIVPHRHVNPPKHETFIVMEGAVAVVTFSDDGEPEDWLTLDGSNLFGVDLAAGVWHTLVILSEHAVCFEVKPGPWDPATDKEFASWAPPEHDRAAARAYVSRLREYSGRK